MRVTAFASSPAMVCAGGAEACPPRLAISRCSCIWPFGGADERAGLLDAREHALHHGPALVEHQRGRHAARGERVHDVGRRGAGDLFLAGEGEVDVVLRREAALDELLGRLQAGAEGYLGVQRAAAVEHAVLDHAAEGRLRPGGLVGGDDVVVRHQHGGRAVPRAFPVIQQPAAADVLRRAFFMHGGEALGQQGAEFIKFRGVLQRVVQVGDRFAADHVRQVVDGLLPVHADGIRRRRGLLARLKAQRARGEHGAQRAQRGG